MGKVRSNCGLSSIHEGCSFSEKMKLLQHASGILLWEINFLVSRYYLDTTDEVAKEYGLDTVGGLNALLKRFAMGSEESLKRAIKNHIESKSDFFRTDVSITVANGEVRPAEIYGKITEYTEEGNVKTAIGTLTDLGYVGKIQQELLKRAEEKNNIKKLKEIILNNLSHELRTPLNGIYGMVQMMGQTVMDEEQKEYCEILEKSCIRMNRLIENVLNYSDFSLTADLKVTEGVDLVALLYQVINTVKDMYWETRKNIKIQYDPQIQYICMMPLEYIQMILEQLLDNAYKYSTGDLIFINVSEKEGFSVEIAHSGELQVFMQQEDLIDGVRSGVVTRENCAYKSGMGLLLTAKISERTGIKVSYKSSHADGTHFLVQIPKDQSVENIYSFDGTEKIKALIVDPDRSSRNLLKKHLESFSMELREADTLICKNNSIENGFYDVIFHAVEDQIQTGSCNRKTILDKEGKKVWVALSSLSMRKRHHEYLKNGYDYCASKPIETETIHEIMNQIIMKRRR